MSSIKNDNLIKLQRIFAEVLVDPGVTITEETSKASLPEWDSVASLQIALAVESEFGKKLTMDQIAQVQAVRDVLALLESDEE
jgi:acyl carrier protein